MQLSLVCWMEDGFWLGTLEERPDIMTQGETLWELCGNIQDACTLMCECERDLLAET